MIRELLGRLLHAGVQVPDDRLRAQDGLAVELHHEAQHAVRRRVLRAHVDDHGLVVETFDVDVGHVDAVALGKAQHRPDLATQLVRRGVAGSPQAAELAAAARAAEEAGFDSLWASALVLPDPQVPPSPMAPQEPRSTRCSR